MPRPVHFEFSADDPDKLADYYREVLGWKITKWEGPMDYWLIETGEEGEPGIDGGFGKRDDKTPPGTVNTIDVPDIDEFMERATAAGGKVITPKMAVTGVGWMCYVMDPEGNVFGLMESDKDAK
jgi:predicted enzyme related to lactoylglutathione lyase